MVCFCIIISFYILANAPTRMGTNAGQGLVHSANIALKYP